MSSVHLSTNQRWLVDALRSRPHMRLVVVGETGTGKTTALLTALRAMADTAEGTQALFVSSSSVAAHNMLARARALGLGAGLVNKKSLRSTVSPEDLRVYP